VFSRISVKEKPISQDDFKDAIPLPAKPANHLNIYIFIQGDSGQFPRDL
jgi:hypothetical protein